LSLTQMDADRITKYNDTPMREKFPDVTEEGFMTKRENRVVNEMETFEKGEAPYDEFFSPDGAFCESFDILL